MRARVNYRMTEEDLKILLEACKPTPVMMIGDYATPRPTGLGKKMGFNYKTVRPILGKEQEYFSAIPSKSEAQKKEAH